MGKVRSEESGPLPASALGAVETVEIPAGVFKNTCLSLMDDVLQGTREYLITKHGRPVAKLVPPDAEAPSAFGFLRGTLLRQDDIIAPELEAWGEAVE
jgi:prevent-host-death family protein